MNKAMGWVATIVMGGALAAAAVMSFKDAPSQAASSGSGLEKVKGYIALDVEPILKDPEAQAIFEKRGLAVSFVRIGSREMAERVATEKPDFFVASGTVAASGIQEAAKKAGLGAQIGSPFHTPLTIASWTLVGEALAANGIAKIRPAAAGAVPVYDVDMGKLLAVMESKAKWSDLKGGGWKAGKSILISTTDPRKSNSAAMYLALMAASANGGENPQTIAEASKLADRIAPLFKRQGYQETYVNGAFDDWSAIGIGKVPMAFVYESQIMERAMSGGLPDGAAILLPKPTIANKEVFVALSEGGRKLMEAFSDPAMQALGAKYGFRGQDAKAFAAVSKKAGVAVEVRISELSDPPAPGPMNEMLGVVSTALSN